MQSRVLALAGVTLILGVMESRGAGAPDSREAFVKLCAPCHGEDGRARTRAARVLGVKDLTVSKTTDAEIERQIREGRQDAKGIQKMPPFKERLQPEQIEALVRYVKALRKPE